MMKIAWVWRTPLWVDYLLNTQDARFETIAYWARQNQILCLAPSTENMDWTLMRSGNPNSGRFQVAGIGPQEDQPAFQRVLQYLRDFNPDVVVCEGPFQSDEWRAVQGTTPNAFHALYYGGGPFWDLNGKVFEMCDTWDVIFVPHETQRKWLQPQVKPLVIKAYGIPRNTFHPLGLKKQYHAFYPANFTPGKRNAIVAQYLEQFAPDHLPSLLLGGMENMAVLEQSRLGGMELNNPGPSRNRAIIGGRAPQVIMPMLYNLSEVMISASQEEGHPNCVFEAMACGTPAIVMSDCEWFVGEQCKELADRFAPCISSVPCHPEAIAAAVEEIKQMDPAQLSRDCVWAIQREYDWWTMYQRIDQACRNGKPLKDQGKTLRQVWGEPKP